MGCFPGYFQEGKWPIKALGETAHGLFLGSLAMVDKGPSKKAHEEVCDKYKRYKMFRQMRFGCIMLGDCEIKEGKSTIN